VSLVVSGEESEIEGMIMELSAGVGGQEAMLFCNQLLDMYLSYCENQGWEYELIQGEKTDLEGMRHASVSIDSPAAYNSLQFESGVHRVQRVPKTEKAGRIHTSTVTVAIFPKPSEVTVTIDPNVIFFSNQLVLEKHTFMNLRLFFRISKLKQSALEEPVVNMLTKQKVPFA